MLLWVMNTEEKKELLKVKNLIAEVFLNVI